MSSLLSILSAFIFSVSAQAILIEDFSAGANQANRFANDAAFVGSGYDLSGLALTDGGKWVSMISPNVYLSSQHFRPSGSVTFYQTNNPLGPTLTRQVSGTSQRIGNSDLYIGTLDTPLTTDYGYFGYATTTTTTIVETGPVSERFSNSPYFNEDVLMVGRSATDFSETSQDMALATNVVNYWFDEATAAGTTDVAIAADYNPTNDLNDVSLEGLVQGGDSGSPLLIDEGGGSLTIVGIGWFRYERNGTQEGSGYGYLGNYTSEIENFLDANSLAAIPESSAAVLLAGLFGLGAVVYRRRRR